MLVQMMHLPIPDKMFQIVFMLFIGLVTQRKLWIGKPIINLAISMAKYIKFTNMFLFALNNDRLIPSKLQVRNLSRI